jgi:hypothetical protein
MGKAWVLCLLVLAGCTSSGAPPPNYAPVTANTVPTTPLIGIPNAPYNKPTSAQDAMFSPANVYEAQAYGKTIHLVGRPQIEPTTPPPTYSSPGGGSWGCTSGNYYGAISCVTGLPKTTHVRSYFRKDGTFVQSHYRSRR